MASVVARPHGERSIGTSASGWLPESWTRCSRLPEEEYRSANDPSRLQTTRSTAFIIPPMGTSTGAMSERPDTNAACPALVTNAHFPPGAIDAESTRLNIGDSAYVAPG